MIRSIRYQALGGSALLTSVWALWLGCGSPAVEEPPPVIGETPPIAHYGTNASALTRAKSCEEVLATIQDNTVARLIERAEELRQPPPDYYGEPGVVIDTPGMIQPSPPAAPETLADNPLLSGGQAPSPTAGPATPVAEGGSGFSDTGFSDTTVQVRDVDEADVVKSDGDFLYVIQGNNLVKVRAWPADATETVASVSVEGQPLEMFVRDGKAVVYSSVYRDLSQPDPNAGYSRYYPYYYSSPGYTKVTVLDVDGETPEVLREAYLEGSYVSARRHDAVVRTIVQAGYKVPPLDGAYIEYFTPFGEPYRQIDIDAQVDAWLSRTIWAVTQTELGDWLPRQYGLVDGEVVEQAPSCGDFYQPDVDLSQTGVTQVFALNLDTDDGEAKLGGATVLARAERVYANDNVVLLAQTDYGSFENGYSESTTLHRFDLAGDDTVYTASGSLPGYIQSQFSLDEHEGTIRVSTTQNRFSGAGGEQTGPKNRVLTLATSGGWLDVWGQTEVFGQNEQIFATRFIGDLGYVVTFRQTDPLFVVDLSDPGNPEVVGELTIPGFSNFLFPLDATHLFAIGRDATAEGRAQGLALSIFDVSDPTSPALAHKYVYDGQGYSDANVDHRAITFHPDAGRLAFPLQAYTPDYSQSTSTLEVFDVDVAAGFTRRGGISPDAPEITLEECVILLGYGPDALGSYLQAEIDASPGYAEYLLSQCRGSEQMRRGVFRDEYVYGISTRAIYAHTVDGLSAPPVGSASLPPAYDYYYGGPIPVSGVAGSAMGSGGSSFDIGIAGSASTAGSAGAAGAAGAGGAPNADMP